MQKVLFCCHRVFLMFSTFLSCLTLMQDGEGDRLDSTKKRARFRQHFSRQREKVTKIRLEFFSFVPRPASHSHVESFFRIIYLPKIFFFRVSIFRETSFVRKWLSQ